MKKNDFRLQIPLWNITLYLILSIWAYIMCFQDKNDIFTWKQGQLAINWSHMDVILLLSYFVLTSILLISMTYKMKQHNRLYPNKKIKLFSTFKLNELIEDDEFLQQVSERATKKVYILYTLTLPVVIFIIILFPLHRFIYVLFILALLIAHNIIYYQEMNVFFKESYSEFEQKKSMYKFNKWLQILVSVTFVSFTIVYAYQNLINVVVKVDVTEELKACEKQGKTGVLYFGPNEPTRVVCENK